MRPLDRKLKTLRRYHITGAAYFVTASTRHRQPFFASSDHARRAAQALYELRGSRSIQLLAFVIMPDHVHLLVVPPDGLTISEIMTRFKWEAPQSIRRSWKNSGPKGRATGRLWEERFYDRVIRHDDELRGVVTYIHWNPVKAGLCREPEDFQFSSAHPDHPTDIERVFGESD